jgi:polysaccharide export outer membrane protein
MRPSRLIVLVAIGLVLCGCARRPTYVYAYPGAQSAPVFAQPAYPQATYPPAAYPQADYPQAAYRQPAPQTGYPPQAAYPVQQPAYTAPQSGYAQSTAGAYAYAAPATQQAYTLDAGDRLRITVFGQDGLTNSYIVDAAGNVNLSLIGSVPARGYTTQQLARAIADRLRQGYIREPHVSVEVEAYRPFFILGEVNAPGQYPYTPNTTVESAVAIAGGFGPRAQRSSVRISRNVNGRVIQGKVPLNFPLQPGDTITVPERWF